jgi:RNA polymerase sigma-70 factor (ECF subfamily)
MSDRTTHSSDEEPIGRVSAGPADLIGEDAGAPGLGVDRAVVHDLREARLFARAAEGDRDAIAEVWRSNRRWIAAVLAAHAPRDADVDDLLQEVAATLIAKSHHIRDAASLRGWLRVVAINAARMAARSRSVESRVVRGLAYGRAGSMTREESEREARETLALLSRLPAHYAEPLLLQATQGLSQRQIAELLDVPETTVETRLARGRRMLRQILQELEVGDERVARRAGGAGTAHNDAARMRQP